MIGARTIGWIVGAAGGAAFPYGNVSPTLELTSPASQDWRDQADRLWLDGLWTEAEEVVRTHLVEHEDDGEARQMLALMLRQHGLALGGEQGLTRHLADGLIWEARAHYEELMEADLSATAPRIGIARCDESLGDVDGAIAGLDEARDRAIENGESTTALSEETLRVALAAGLLDTVEARLERGQLGDTPADLWRLRIAGARKDTEAAATLASSLGGDSPLAWEIGSLLWSAHEGRKDSIEVLLHLYSTLCEAHPETLDYRYFRAATRLSGLDPAGAEFDLHACEPDLRLRLPVRYYLGRALLAQGKPDDALAAFRDVVAAGGMFWQESLNGMLDAAAQYGMTNRHAEALPIYHEVLEWETDNEWALLNLPLCHKGMGDVGQAESSYRRGLELRPDHPQLQNDLALLLRGAGREAEARQIFEAARACGSVDSTENLGVIAFWETGDMEKAADDFARVLVLEPDRPKSRFYRELCMSRGEHEERSREGAGAGAAEDGGER